MHMRQQTRENGTLDIYRRQIDNGTVMLIRKGTASGETLCYQNKDPAFNSDMGL